MQRVIKSTPRRQHLRHLQHGNLVALDIQRHTLLHLNTKRLGAVKASSLQAREQGVMRDDASAPTIHRTANFFEHANVVAFTVQHIGREKPAQRAADDDYF